jgi:predicted phosphodiesterase
MIEKNSPTFLFLIVIFFLVLVISSACIPLAPTGIPTTHLVPVESVTQVPTATRVRTATLISSATLVPILTPSPTYTPTLTPTLTHSPQPIIISDALSEVRFNLPLTIQHVGETEATLFFELETPAEGYLIYWPSAVADQRAFIPLAKDEARHQIRLEDLMPGTQYRAVVGLSAGENLYQLPNFRGMDWGLVNFHTLGGDEPLRIGVIGDSGYGEESTFALAEQMAAHNLDFVLHTGDLVYYVDHHPDPLAAFVEKYYKPLTPLLHELPIYPVVGNHDIEIATYWQGKPFYYHAFPPVHTPDFPPSDFNQQNQWYAIAVGRIQFLMLDTQTLFGEDGNAEQTAWMEERLADERFDFTIPVFHVPPYSSGPHRDEGPIVEQVWGHLLNSDKVPVVISGHDHFYERLKVDGITYLVSGGGSSVLYKMIEQHPQSQIFARQMHFVLMEMYADRINISAIAATGELLDQFNILLVSPGS